MIYTMTLNPALDYIIDIESLSTENINRAKKERLYPGGKGINVSIVLTRLGIENTALGFLAGFSGRRLEEMLIEDKIKADFVYLASGDTRINVKIRSEIELDVNASGPNILEDDVERLLEKCDMLSSGDFIVLSGSIPPSAPDNLYDRILSRVSSRGCEAVVDAEGDLLLGSLKYKPFLIKPNHKELGAIFSDDADTLGKTIDYAVRLKNMGARNVIVSRAENGAVLVDERGVVTSVEAARGEFVSSAGCGDSMIAGFLAGYVKSESFEDALRLGAACGSATAFSHGLAKTEKIEKIMLERAVEIKRAGSIF